MQKRFSSIRTRRAYLLLLSNSSWGLRGLDSDFRFDGECFSAATNTEIQLERFENRNLIDPLIKKAFKTNWSVQIATSNQHKKYIDCTRLVSVIVNIQIQIVNTSNKNKPQSTLP